MYYHMYYRTICLYITSLMMSVRLIVLVVEYINGKEKNTVLMFL